MARKIWHGVAGIVKKNDAILMIRTKNSNSWSVPSGGIEAYETAEQACVREIAEETGYEVNVVKALHTKKAIIKDYEVTTYYYLCEIIGGDIQYNDPDDEIAEIAWKSKEELSSLVHMYPEDEALLQQLFV